jgi:hypothetical protein
MHYSPTLYTTKYVYYVFIPVVVVVTMTIITTSIIQVKVFFLLILYLLLAKIPGVSRDSIRNEGTREINYGIKK